MSKQSSLGRILTYIFLTAGAIIMLFPFYWMFSSSFKTLIENMAFPPKFIPSNWLNFDNYVEVFHRTDVLKYFKNSFIVLIFEVGLSTLTSILGAYAYSRLRFFFRKLGYAVLLAFMMVPSEVMMITNYQTIVKMGLVNTLIALWIPWTTSVFYTTILKNFFDSVPDSLYYSAKVDGCSNWKYLWRVLVPIARSSIFTVILLNSIMTFNSYLWTQLVIYSDDFRTIPLAIQMVVSEFNTNPNLQMAVATMMVIPTTLIFIVCRKYIVGGVARGGLKG